MRKVTLAAIGLALALSGPARAQQPAKPAAPAADAGGLSITAPVQKIRPNGIRLEGTAAQPARIQSPEIDVSALVIAFDFEGNQIKEVRAQNQVSFKLNMQPKDPKGTPARVEATSDAATLDPVKRTLALRGHVAGWYQVKGGQKNTLSGGQADLKYVDTKVDGKTVNNLVADIAGGVIVKLPPESGDAQHPAPLGTVTLTADRATLDQSAGIARFIGNARAVSDDGPNKLDVSATEFTLTQGATGTIDTLKTVGRTHLKIDLPPEPAKPAKPVTVEANAAGDELKTEPKTQISRPTHVEAEADRVTVTRANNTLVFEGHVSGFYRLAPAGAAAQEYKFSGDRAVLTNVGEKEATPERPAGLNVEFTGQPGQVEIPGLVLGK